MNAKTKQPPAQPIMMACDSSQVDSIGYLHDEQLLVVMFKFGGLYAYHKVPENVFLDAAAAESIGKFLESDIKPNFKFTKLHGMKHTNKGE